MRHARTVVLGLFAVGVAACQGARPADEPVGTPPVVTPRATLKGFLDAVAADGQVMGWALEPSFGAEPVQVAVYLDGDRDTGTLAATVRAGEARADLNETLGVDGPHGFVAPLDAAWLDGAPHVVHAYGLGLDGAVELGGSPVTFQHVEPACATAGPKVAPEATEFVVTLRGANGRYVSADCGGDDVGRVTVDADAAGEWQTFYLSVQPGGAVALRSSHGRYLSAEELGGQAVHANRAEALSWERLFLEGPLVDGAQVRFRTPDGAHFLSAGAELNAQATAAGANETFTLGLATPVPVRHGVVRGDSRTFVDDDGPFNPLGATLFWALRGWKDEPERVKRNLEFLARHHWDYVRILGEVDWAGNDIDPAWPEYQQLLGELIDYAYDRCGLRVELTLVGGRGDPLAMAQQVTPVILAGRTHKLLDVEVANESYGRPVTLEQLRAAGRYLRQNLPNLVALSSGEGLNAYAPNSSDWRADFVSVYMQPDSANLATIHMDRGYGDLGWRVARQPWDWKDFPFPVAHNEPIGPRSSVREETDVVRLAMLRAVGLINGVGAFVLHNGAGVAGRVDVARNRPANLWEVPDIDAIMDAVRGVDAFVPPRVGEGQHWNNAWGGNPWVADAFWGDGADHGVNRNYTVSTPDGWVSTEGGVKDYVELTTARKSRVEVFDALEGKVDEVHLEAGATLRLAPVSKDDAGLGAFIVVGHYE